MAAEAAEDEAVEAEEEDASINDLSISVSTELLGICYFINE